MSNELITASKKLNSEVLLTQVAMVHGMMRVTAPGAEILLHLSNEEVSIRADGVLVYAATHAGGHGVEKRWTVTMSPISFGDEKVPESWKSPDSLSELMSRKHHLPWCAAPAAPVAWNNPEFLAESVRHKVHQPSIMHGASDHISPPEDYDGAF